MPRKALPSTSKSASAAKEPKTSTKAKATTPKKRKQVPAVVPDSPPPDPEPAAPKQRRRVATEPKAPVAKRPKVTLLSVDDYLPKASAAFVLTCGNGDTGQLGHGEDLTVVKRPRQIKSFPDGTRFMQAIAGGMHSVVLTSNFEVFTSGCSDEGALGRPCYNDEGELEEKDEDFTFRKVSFPEGCTDLVMISAGDSHTAALTRSGSVFIWGTFRNKGGLLGLAMEKPKDQDNDLFGKVKKAGQTMKKTKQPFLLSSSKDRIVVKIASGSDHIVMLTQEGKIFTSGAGDAGQLGRLSPHARESSISERTIVKMMTPAEVSVKLGVSFVDIWCATYCSFARAVDGKIYVWGLNNYQQLGLKSNDQDAPDQTEVHYPIPSRQFDSTKVWKGFAGDHHILAVDNEGKCYGIGRGDDCRLGQGEDKTTESATLVEISSDGVVGVAAATGTSFMWKNDGRGYAWGLNNEAELGLNVDEGAVVGKPKEIEVRGIDGGVRIIQISSNAQHAIFLANRMNAD